MLPLDRRALSWWPRWRGSAGFARRNLAAYVGEPVAAVLARLELNLQAAGPRSTWFQPSSGTICPVAVRPEALDTLLDGLVVPAGAVTELARALVPGDGWPRRAMEAALRKRAVAPPREEVDMATVREQVLERIRARGLDPLRGNVPERVKREIAQETGSTAASVGQIIQKARRDARAAGEAVALPQLPAGRARPDQEPTEAPPAVVVEPQVPARAATPDLAEVETLRNQVRGLDEDLIQRQAAVDRLTAEVSVATAVEEALRRKLDQLQADLTAARQERDEAQAAAARERESAWHWREEAVNQRLRADQAEARLRELEEELEARQPGQLIPVTREPELQERVARVRLQAAEQLLGLVPQLEPERGLEAVERALTAVGG